MRLFVFNRLLWIFCLWITCGSCVNICLMWHFRSNISKTSLWTDLVPAHDWLISSPVVHSNIMYNNDIREKKKKEYNNKKELITNMIISLLMAAPYYSFTYIMMYIFSLNESLLLYVYLFCKGYWSLLMVWSIFINTWLF